MCTLGAPRRPLPENPGQQQAFGGCQGGNIKIWGLDATIVGCVGGVCMWHVCLCAYVVCVMCVWHVCVHGVYVLCVPCVVYVVCVVYVYVCSMCVAYVCIWCACIYLYVGYVCA